MWTRTRLEALSVDFSMRSAACGGLCNGVWAASQPRESVAFMKKKKKKGKIQL
jgi:hypothetical protein